MINRGVIGVALIIALLVLAGCATTGMTEDEKSEAYELYIVEKKLTSLKSVSAFRFDGWGELGNKHLIVSTTFKRPYLIVLKSNCYDLRYSNGIIINNTGSVLSAKFDSISVPNNIPMRCYIKSIYKLTKEQKKELMAIGRAVPEKEEAEPEMIKTNN